jgi:uncharacterized SAM-binding protein YcdF (DUF218 family)
MYLFLSKFLPLLVYPLGLAFLVLFFAYFRNERGKEVGGWLLAVVALIWLAGNSWASMALARSLEWRYLPQETPQTAPVMVVLGGGTEPAHSPRMHVEVNGAGDRMITAALLYHSGAAEHILVSGGGINWMDGREVSIAAEMETLLVLMGVPPEAIIHQDRSANTYEDALYSAEILAEMGVEEILLVTSAMHMPRSVAVFEAQGLTVYPAPTDFKITQTSWDALFKPTGVENFLFSVIPSVSNVGLTTAVIKEYLGMLVYSLNGWM